MCAHQKNTQQNFRISNNESGFNCCWRLSNIMAIEWWVPPAKNDSMMGHILEFGQISNIKIPLRITNTVSNQLGFTLYTDVQF